MNWYGQFGNITAILFGEQSVISKRARITFESNAAAVVAINYTNQGGFNDMLESNRTLTARFGKPFCQKVNTQVFC